MRIITFVVLVAGCGSVTTEGALVAGKDGEVLEVGPGVEVAQDAALDSALDAHADAGVNAVPADDGPFGGLHTVDIPALRNDEPPMRGEWTLRIDGTCVGAMDNTVTPDGAGWTIAGTWFCTRTEQSISTRFTGAVTGDHDWNTDAVNLTLSGDGGGIYGGELQPYASGSAQLTGALHRPGGDVSFVALH